MLKELPSLNTKDLNHVEENTNRQNTSSNNLKAGKNSLPSYLPHLENSANNKSIFMELKHKDNYSDTLYEDVENFMFNPELTKEYERIKIEYKDLIDMFQESIKKDIYLDNKFKKNVDNSFKSLEDFDNAINAGDVNLDKYSIKEINALMLDLTRLEEKVYNRDLEDYGLKTVRDFHRAIDNGILNLNKYDIKEINKLLDSLEDDDKLKLSDYNISLFGNITIGEIHIKIEKGLKDYSKLIGLGELPSTDAYEDIAGPEIINPNEKMKNKTSDIEKLEQIYTDGYEIENNFIDKIIDFIKKIFKQKKDP